MKHGDENLAEKRLLENQIAKRKHRKFEWNYYHLNLKQHTY
jgi:hypothetical protein